MIASGGRRCARTPVIGWSASGSRCCLRNGSSDASFRSHDEAPETPGRKSRGRRQGGRTGRRSWDGTGTLFDGKWTPIYQKMLSGDVTVEDGVAQMDKLLKDFVKDA